MRKNRKRRKNVYKRKRLIIINALLVLFLFLGIGYSALSTDLNINGNITVKEFEKHTLYNVLKKETEEGYAKEFIGEHHDSFTEEPSKKIYHWWADNETDATTIMNKYNVIFADHCWQMIRTTDTGGVKMIYNGEVENGQCLNTRGKHIGYYEGYLSGEEELSTEYYYGQDYTFDKNNGVFSLEGTVNKGEIEIGQYTCMNTSPTGTCTRLYYVDHLIEGNTYQTFIIANNSDYFKFGGIQYTDEEYHPAHAGYMYNYDYKIQDNKLSTTNEIYDYGTLQTTYYYADSYDYNTSTYKYTLTNPYQVTSSNDFNSLVGKYTVCSYDSTYSSKTLYYIAGVDGDRFYFIKITNGKNLDYYNDSYTYGDSYTDNGDGTYSVNNPTTITKVDYYSHYNELSSKYICINAPTNTCNNMIYTLSAEKPKYEIEYIDIANNYKYANGFTYNNTTNTYILNNNSVNFFDITKEENSNSINNHHYTCFNVNGECAQLSYIYSVGNTSVYYINLSNGKSIETAINEMFHANGVNQKNSTIKSALDAWYEKYMSIYTPMLEDTIFCNDRAIYDLGPFDPNGGNIHSDLLFNHNNPINNDNLNCINETDMFSTSNTKAHLIYPAGLLTYQERRIMNYAKPEIKAFSGGYYTMTPTQFTALSPYIWVIRDNGGGVIGGDPAVGTQGLRPVISLKPDTEYNSGDGSFENPYIVGESISSYFQITNTDTTINVPNRGKYGTTITLKSNEYIITSFKVNGSLINGNSFVMPAEDVVISDIQKMSIITVESEHNPYPNSQNNVTYYENTFTDATSLTVELTYQTESTSYDWVYLYTEPNSSTPFNNKKYGGSTQTTETITIPSNYIKIVFRTDSSVNNYYGFKAVITPNYD